MKADRVRYTGTRIQKNGWRAVWNSFKRREQGSFSLEATLVFPLVLLATLLILMFTIWVYEKAVLQYVAQTTAQRATFVWLNSAADPRTGQVAAGEHDGLYWRLSDDRVLDALFGLAGNLSPVTVKLGDGSTGSSESVVTSVDGEFALPELKMSRAAAWLPERLHGSITYTNLLIKREVVVQLENRIRLPFIANRSITATAKSVVADPVEFTRSVDLIRSYASKLKGSGSGTGSSGEGTIDRGEAGRVLLSQKNKK